MSALMWCLNLVSVRRTTLVAISAAMVGAACSETGAPGGRAGQARVLLTVASALSGEVLEIASSYRRTNATIVPLATTEVALEDGASQTISFDIDLSECLADGLREAAGGGCPIRLRLELRDASGEVIDTSSVGPLDAEPDEVLSAIAVTLRHAAAIVLTIANATLLSGTTGTVTSQVFDRGNTPLTGRLLTWGSSNVAVASVNQLGTVAAVSPGQATIRAALSGRTTGPEGTVLVTVVSVQSVTVAPPNSTLDPGGQVQLSATVQPSAVPQAVTWSTGDATIATVDNTGRVTAIRRGTTTITARSTADTSRSGGAAITVRGVASVSVAPAIDSVRVGGTRQFVPTVIADAGVSTAALFSSLNPAIATVNSTTGVATAVSVGTVTIRATSVADVTKFANATLVVSACGLPIQTTIGQTVNAVLNASSCGVGQFVLEHIAYSGNAASPAILVSGTAPWGFDFAPLRVPRGYWYFPNNAGATINAQVWAGAGSYSSFIQNRVAGQFGPISWTTSAIPPACGRTISATNLVVGPFAFTNSCPVSPGGAPLVPAGTYYGISIDLVPPLIVGEGYTIQATTNGFTPRIVMWNIQSPSVRYEAIGAGTSATLTVTATTQGLAGYHLAVVTSATPALTGNITISISGPNPTAPSFGNPAAAVLGGAPNSAAPRVVPVVPPFRP